MNDNVFNLLKKSPLFWGIDEGDLRGLLGCLRALTRRFERDQVIFAAGAPASHVGMVLSGTAQVARDDILGNRSILANLGPGELFAEVFVCAGVARMPVTVWAVSDASVLLLDYHRIITSCANACDFHSRLIENMLKVVAQKNLQLSRKIEALSARSTRDKLMTFLTLQANQAGSRRFDIPFDRQELANYLAVDRSALSREMSAMRAQGLIDYHKNSFHIKTL